MNIEKLETNKLKLTFEVDAQTFEKGLQYSYNKNRGSINIPGFRKGKAPRKIIEIQYGKEIFFEDAISYVLQDAYENAIDENNIETVSRPEVDVESVSAEEGVVFTAEVYVKPEVVLGDYKGITYKPYDANPTDEEINKEIEKAREKNSRIVHIYDRAVEQGDIVNINYEGFVDGVAFDGGKADDYDLTIGSKLFIDTFEEQLIGKNIGDQSQITVRFPDNYHVKELNGKQASFNVKINEIKFKELPEANDEFAQDVSEFDTLEEYKEYLKEKISKAKSEESDRDRESQVMSALIDNCQMDVPDVMIQTQVDQLVMQFSNRLKSQGMSLATYLQYVGQTEEQVRDVYKQSAEAQVKGRLVLEAIAVKENIQIPPEDVDNVIEQMAQNYGVTIEKLKEILRKEDIVGIEKDIMVEKALEIVIGNAVELL